MPPKGKKKPLSHAQKMQQQQLRSRQKRAGEDAHQLVSQASRVSALQGMATTVFTIDALDMKSTKCTNGERKKTKGIGSRNAHKKGMTTTFAKEADYDVERRVKDARRPIGTAPKAYEELRVVMNDDDISDTRNVTVEHQSIHAIDFMPRRPKWHRGGKKETKNRLRLRERKAFAKWARRVKEKMVAKGGYPPAFEQNLEVWRQLWRAMERADVICCVLDARNPMLHFPAALYAHATRVHKKPLVCALNKIDQVPREAAEKWRKCFLEGLPGVDEVIGFIAVEQEEEEEEEEKSDEDEEENEDEEDEEELAKKIYEPTLEMTVGKSALISAAKRVAKYGKRWKNIVENDPHEDEDARLARTKKKNYAFFEDAFENIHGEDEGNDGVPKDECVVALVGHPNVGKSSMINTLLGRKAVSVKATPGHTKTLQTLRLARGVWLCDSPGLVFPRVDVSLPEQIVGGIVPLPVVREPYSSLRWLAEMRDACKDRWESYANSKTSNEKDRRLAEELSKTLPETLKVSALPTDMYDSEILELRDPSDVLEGFLPWSPLSLARGTALKRKLLASGGRPDDRAGGVIALKRFLDGKSPYAVPPPTDAISVEARRDSSHAPYADEDLNIEDEEDFEEELEEMNRMDGGLPLKGEDDGDNTLGNDALDLIDYFEDEDPCFDDAPNEFKNNLQAESSDDDDGDDDGSEEHRVKKGPSNAFAALSLDGDE
jgi:ribosome biogenesis GTPase A